MAKGNRFQSKKFVVVVENFTACSLSIQQRPEPFNFVLKSSVKQEAIDHKFFTPNWSGFDEI